MNLLKQNHLQNEDIFITQQIQHTASGNKRHENGVKQILRGMLLEKKNLFPEIDTRIDYKTYNYEALNDRHLRYHFQKPLIRQQLKSRQMLVYDTKLGYRLYEKRQSKVRQSADFTENPLTFLSQSLILQQPNTQECSNSQSQKIQQNSNKNVLSLSQVNITTNKAQNIQQKKRPLLTNDRIQMTFKQPFKRIQRGKIPLICLPETGKSYQMYESALNQLSRTNNQFFDCNHFSNKSQATPLIEIIREETTTSTSRHGESRQLLLQSLQLQQQMRDNKTKKVDKLLKNGSIARETRLHIENIKTRTLRLRRLSESYNGSSSICLSSLNFSRSVKSKDKRCYTLFNQSYQDEKEDENQSKDFSENSSQ